MFALYESSRTLASDDAALAAEHARGIARAEGPLGLGFEQAFNQWLAAHRVVEVEASFWYASLHYLLTPIVLVLLWRRTPALYRRARSVLVLATTGALGCYLLYPVAPPRLLDGFVDTMRATSSAGWWGGAASAPRGLGGATNQLAAMPSMHVGWALWAGAVVSMVARRVWIKWLARAYPVLTTVVVVATANHWTLDAVGGVAMVGAAAAVVVAWNPRAILDGLRALTLAGAGAPVPDPVRRLPEGVVTAAPRPVGSRPAGSRPAA